MKILHILATPRAEGTPNLVLDWLNTKQYQQEVFVLESSPNDLADKLRAAASWYDETHVGLLSGWRAFPSLVLTAKRVCADRKPDLVICWVLGLATWLCLGARLAGVKTIIAHAGNPPNKGGTNDWLSRYVNWPLMLLGVKVICCSEYVRREMCSIRWMPNNIFYAVHNCSRIANIQSRARTARSRRHDSGCFQAIMVATLERHKDHNTLLLAVTEVLKSQPKFRLILVGDGSLRSSLESLVESLQLEQQVAFLGSRQDVPELLGQSDLFVFSTTHQEGLGSVLIEALAAGLPVVASDVPACRELLDEGAVGELVPANDPHHLAAAIVRNIERGNDVSEEKAKMISLKLANLVPEVMMDRYLKIAGI